MLTKKLLAVSSLVLFGCAQSPPEFPRLEYQYSTMKLSKGMSCVKWKITSLDPYHIDDPEVLPIESCDGIGGFTPHDFNQVFNWASDMKAWAAKKGIK